MTREPGDVPGEKRDGFVLLELGDILDHSPDAADEEAPVLAQGSEIQVLERTSVANAPNAEVDALLLAYLLELDDRGRG